MVFPRSAPESFNLAALELIAIYETLPGDVNKDLVIYKAFNMGEGVLRQEHIVGFGLHQSPLYRRKVLGWSRITFFGARRLLEKPSTSRPSMMGARRTSTPSCGGPEVGRRPALPAAGVYYFSKRQTSPQAALHFSANIGHSKEDPTASSMGESAPNCYVLVGRSLLRHTSSPGAET